MSKLLGLRMLTEADKQHIVLDVLRSMNVCEKQQRRNIILHVHSTERMLPGVSTRYWDGICFDNKIVRRRQRSRRYLA